MNKTAGSARPTWIAPEHLAGMEAASRQLAKPVAAREIVEGCVELIKLSKD